MNLLKIEDTVDLAFSEKSIIEIEMVPKNLLSINSEQYLDFLEYFEETLYFNKLKSNLQSLINCKRSILYYYGRFQSNNQAATNSRSKNYEELKKNIHKENIAALIYHIDGILTEDIFKCYQSGDANYINRILELNKSIFKDFNSSVLDLDHIII